MFSFVRPCGIVVAVLGLLSGSVLPGTAQEDTRDLVKAAFDYWRGKASVSTVEMTIERPSWKRQMTIKAWTRGEKDSLFYILAPPKDLGNGTLKKGREMWVYNPKVNRVIKLPPSMMSQSWMGSDFSNNDLAKSDSLLTDYTHEIVGTERHDGRNVYVVKSIPHPDAPVVWGMQMLRIRADFIFLSEEFFDEDLQSVKIMQAEEITFLGDRLFPRIWTMRRTGETDRFTRLTYRQLKFSDSLPDSLFTLGNLRNPRK
jgi:outer membrane lipoprotein-sorting protein